jgi:SAM-dependent methyltransferase
LTLRGDRYFAMPDVDRESAPQPPPGEAANPRLAWENSLRGRLRRRLLSVPLIGPALVRLNARLRRPDPHGYWEARYRRGEDSGSGSYGRLAEFKAEVLNQLVRERGIRSVVELGCGDGHQLELARYPSYVGLDISETAIARCRARFAHDPSKRFEPAGSGSVPGAECALSLDVILHLTEDALFERYMRDLFCAATRYVVIYSSDFDEPFAAPHVRHREFSRWVAREVPEFELESRIPNRYPSAHGDADSSNADFFVYRRRP